MVLVLIISVLVVVFITLKSEGHTKRSELGDAMRADGFTPSEVEAGLAEYRRGGRMALEAYAKGVFLRRAQEQCGDWTKVDAYIE